MIEVIKLNESFSVIDGNLEELKKINDFLKVEIPGAYFDTMVQKGFKSPYKYFAIIQNKKLLVLNGHLELLQKFGISKESLISDFDDSDLDNFLDSLNLPFEPYDFQIKSFKESILNVKQINRLATSSGKSLIISLIAEFFRQHNMKGLLLVPNINLLSQFHNDLKDYNLNNLYESVHIIGGGSTDRHFKCPLTISTWQSLLEYKDLVKELDYIICDEVQRFASQETSDIITKSIHSKYKLGFTGTIPEDPTMKMQLFGLFGLPKTYITPRELIDRKLGTPLYINSIIFQYNSQDLKILRNESNYSKKLKFIKEHEERNKFIVTLLDKLSGNSLALFSHTEHGKTLFIELMKLKYPDVKVENKNITGKKSFDFQKQYGIYFINGEDDKITREKTRLILEEHENAIILANYVVAGVGSNFKRLHNLVLMSPLKSYTAITQALGRMMRLHPSKDKAQVFDLIDDLGIRKLTGVFYNQYLHRKKTSYLREEYPIKEIIYKLN